MNADHLATDLVQLLAATEHRIVFAESCTAGLIAATCGRIPGVSRFLAGSAVVYQEPTKSCWLNVDETTLKTHGAVSRIVSEQMATGVLQMTPHATIAASITGHLGPNAPPDQDGIAWSAFACRKGNEIHCQAIQLNLDSRVDGCTGLSDTEIRIQRQQTAVVCVLEFCVEQLRDLQKANPAAESTE